jgi:hypothetical protein
MADFDDNAPILGELFGAETSQPRSRAELQDEAARQDFAVMHNDGLCPQLHRMHERRMVHNAGRMVVGVKMPAPSPWSGEAEHVSGETEIFSSAAKKHGAAGASRLAIAIACAVALGSAGVITNIIRPHDAQGPAVAEPDTQRIADVAFTAAMPETAPVNVMAISQIPVGATQVASISPQALESPKTNPSGFVRVAQKDAPTLTVGNVFGPAGKPVRLPIGLNGARPEDYSFLMFRGLPANVTLSAGFRLKESWAVSLRDLDNLTIETPPTFQGAFNLEILLIKGRDTPAESQVISVEILAQDFDLPSSAVAGQPVAPGPQVLTAAPRTIDPAERSAGLPSAGQAPGIRPVAPNAARQQRTPSAAPAAMTAQEQRMMERGMALLNNNDVSSARLLFEHLANSGSARAALAMGQTYDPAYLRTLDAAGLKGDVAKAKLWYRKAADLGDQEASSRLDALASR